MVPGIKLGTEQALNQCLLNAESVYSLLVYSLMVQNGRSVGCSVSVLKGCMWERWARTHNLLTLSYHSSAAEVSQGKRGILGLEGVSQTMGPNFPEVTKP